MRISYFYWPVTFFSTAFGAGIFFLPQSVGPNIVGTNYFLFLMISAAITSCLAHILFLKFIRACPQNDYLTSTSLFIGKHAARVLCLLFLFSMLLIALINFITLVNLIIGYFEDSLTNRFLISCIIIYILSMGSFKYNKEIEKLISKIFLPSVIIILIISTFFITSQPRYTPPSTIMDSNINLFSLIPIVLFIFNFSPCIQRFSRMDSHAKKDVSTIITGVIIIFLFVSLTIFSLSKVLSIHDLFIIKENNNDALSYAAKHTNNYIICIASTLLIACVTSGAYAGTLMGIVDSAESLGFKNRFFVLIVNAIICIAVGTINPSIIKIISNLSVPIIIATVFIIPSVYFIKNGGYVMKATASFVLCSGITVLFFIYP